MSGSNNRPPDRPDPRTLPPMHMRLEHDPFTQPPARTAGHPAPRPPARPLPQVQLQAQPRDDFYAADTAAKAGKDQSKAAIVPPGSVTGKSLTLVITIMCFLACLTAGAVYMINQSAKAWLKDIASEVTVQVEPKGGVDTGATLRQVARLLASTPGVTRTRTLTIDQSAALLEPWLGTSDILKTLPVPRLIALELDRSSPPDLAGLRKTLADRFAGVTLDDHRHWQHQIRTVTRSFALGGLAILLLVGAATTAIIVSATRSSLASNREIVEVLHFVGATDKFIAREFERHFLRLGIRAGFVGAAFAMLVFFSMPAILQLLGGGTITATEMQRLIGPGTLDLMGYIWLCVVVVVIAALCMITSRVGVKRILHSQH